MPGLCAAARRRVKIHFKYRSTMVLELPFGRMTIPPKEIDEIVKFNFSE